MADPSYTPTERRLLALLADGEPHSRESLRACLWDEQGPPSNVRPHLSRIRRRLRPQGQDILCVIHNRTVHYRRVCLFPCCAQQPAT